MKARICIVLPASARLPRAGRRPPAIIPLHLQKEKIMTLTGRIALVTGASQGIGRACALKLAGAGATVALAARNQEKLNDLVQQIGSGKAASFPLDVGDEEQIK